MREQNVETDQLKIAETANDISEDGILAYIEFQTKLDALKERGGNAKEVSILEAKSKPELRKEQISAAKIFLCESVRTQKRAHEHPLRALEKTQEITQSTLNSEIDGLVKNANKVQQDPGEG